MRPRTIVALIAPVLLFAVGCGDPGAATLGGTCMSVDDCTQGQICLTGGVPMGYCSQTCPTVGAQDGCPSNGVCADVSTNSGTQRICTLICQMQAECRTGYQCNGVSGSPFKSCRPN